MKGPSARSRRRHPAKGARIAAAGLSITAMLGIVAGLGAQSPPVSVAVEEGPPAVIPVGVVTVDPQTAAPTEVTLSELSGQPVQLTATPVVRAAQPAPAAPAPVARTNGSR